MQKSCAVKRSLFVFIKSLPVISILLVHRCRLEIHHLGSIDVYTLDIGMHEGRSILVIEVKEHIVVAHQ